MLEIGFRMGKSALRSPRALVIALNRKSYKCLWVRKAHREFQEELGFYKNFDVILIDAFHTNYN